MAGSTGRWMVLHFLAAGVFLGWFIIMPQGFPINHPRFWSNGCIPLSGAIIALMITIACLRNKPGSAAFLFPTLPSLVSGLVLTCLVLFFHSLFSIRVLVVLFPWLYLMFSYGLVVRKFPFDWRAGLVTILGCSLGSFWAYSQRAPEATTRPFSERFPADANPVSGPAVWAARTFESGSTMLSLTPFMDFESTSPDGFWTLFSPDHSPVHDLEYALSETNDHRFTCWTKVIDKVDSHLNTFTDITIYGKHALSVEFSPCPGKRFEILPFDYPVGRPARAAYLDAQGVFNIVEATSGEKGPYNLLASGPHDLEQPITLRIFDGERLAFEVTFDDFSRQCSTDLSPTAGWGFPQNSIQFVAMQDDVCSAFIALNLASTSVGRGWDSVGHEPGVYRNRVRVVSIIGESSQL